MTRDQIGCHEESDEAAASEVAPSPVLSDVIGALSPGRALDVATGHGRNAISLAERGWTVDAIDISRAMLDPARRRADDRGVSVNWLLADVDDYCFPSGAYDLVTISFFDTRDRLDAIRQTLVPGGVLCYEHHLVSEARAGPGVATRYRFEPGELRTLVDDMIVAHYVEDLDARRVELVARNPSE
ncbi:methyltransferase type 11 [Halovivax asiaticus JCM 14624]|uniref:Methyltransferase type 11 n=1 Tax=Halovivax asiaticus JCM 14624 TaxID=1227490 RepID=M0BRC8_9EURY|nr:class I SAM-dependent methyltransferase [Halovivax asiaticus]ELZ12672.1 methyltransferase type 11 [Halovivax asiaticus JCM 14624]